MIFQSQDFVFEFLETLNHVPCFPNTIKCLKLLRCQLILQIIFPDNFKAAMQNQKLTLLRLNKEQKQLLQDPMTNALVKREGTFKFHFCLCDMQAPYARGFYHGVLDLPENYPFSAPKLIFYTQNGRFQVNLPICTTFTNYHPESWTSAWNVRTMILATISFMYSKEPGYGSKEASAEIRKKFARESLKNNLKNPLFRQLFAKQLREKGENISLEVEPAEQMMIEPGSLLSEPQQLDRRPLNNALIINNNRRRKFYIVCGIMVVVIAIGAYVVICA